MTKTKRKTKTFVTVLLSGKLRRLEKALVADVQEQYTLGGGAGHRADNENRSAICIG